LLNGWPKEWTEHYTRSNYYAFEGDSLCGDTTPPPDRLLALAHPLLETTYTQKGRRNAIHHPIDLGQAIEVVDEIECDFCVIASLAHHAPPAQNVLRFRGYNEARTTSENFIDCALLTKVKTLTFSNEFISSIMWRHPSDMPIFLSSLKLNSWEEHTWRQP
jgi:hypothetical protein